MGFPAAAGRPTGVLVVTVWTENGELHRVVSRTEPGADGAIAIGLQRHPAPSDDAVLEVVTDWLRLLERSNGRPGPIQIVPPLHPEGGGSAVE